jgi:hypothetical protein
MKRHRKLTMKMQAAMYEPLCATAEVELQRMLDADVYVGDAIFSLCLSLGILARQVAEVHAPGDEPELVELMLNLIIDAARITPPIEEEMEQ